MSESPRSITTGEPLARRMMLVQAIETSDTQGKLLSPAEREDIDRLALQSARKGAPAHAVTALTAVRSKPLAGTRRTSAAGGRKPQPGAGIAAAAPALDAVGRHGRLYGGCHLWRSHRPHRQSAPGGSAVAAPVGHHCLEPGHLWRPDRQLFPASPESRTACFRVFLIHALGRRPANWHRRSGQLRVKVTAVFMRHWYGATAALQAQRCRAKSWHLAAAGWALGIALSLFSRGLVVEYRVGWESTFLNAEQVHAILRVLLLPATALFPFQSFTVQDIASLQFSNGSGAMAGARWVYLYATLLAVVVILPRLGLALYAGWRERMLARRIMVNLSDPYYKRLLAMLNPTRIQLGLIALRDEDRAALLRLIRPRPQTLHAGEGAHGLWQTLIRTSTGEELFMANIPVSTHPQPPPQAMNESSSWRGRLLAGFWERALPVQHRKRTARLRPRMTTAMPCCSWYRARTI